MLNAAINKDYRPITSLTNNLAASELPGIFYNRECHCLFMLSDKTTKSEIDISSPPGKVSEVKRITFFVQIMKTGDLAMINLL